MNRVIINFGLIRYILNSKYIVISLNSITQIDEKHDYKYWTYKIYFEYKITSNFDLFNHAVP